MNGSILNRLLSKADNAIYSGVKQLDQLPNSIGMSTPLFKERAMQRLGNVNDFFVDHKLDTLRGKNNIKIRNTGGLGNTPLLQDFYEILTRK